MTTIKLSLCTYPYSPQSPSHSIQRRMLVMIKYLIISLATSTLG